MRPARRRTAGRCRAARTRARGRESASPSDRSARRRKSGEISVNRYDGIALGRGPLEQRFGAAAEPAAELEDRAVPLAKSARRRDRPDRIADAVERVRVREVLRPGDHALGVEERLLAGELAAEDRRIALGRHRGDAIRRQAALVVRGLRRQDLLRVGRRERLSPRGSARCRPCPTPARPTRARRASRAATPRVRARRPGRARRGRSLRPRWPARRTRPRARSTRNAAAASRATYSSIRSQERAKTSSKSGRISGGISRARRSGGARCGAVGMPGGV